MPFILAAWGATNDNQKLNRWVETVQWAKSNNCLNLINDDEIEFYEVVNPTDYEIGPLGGPLYLPWSFDSKKPLDSKTENELFSKLVLNWINIVGEQLGQITKPIKFSGKKRRKLIVYAEPNSIPPWGSWHELPAPRYEQEKRRTFTKFREAINKEITPHIVDHVVFFHAPSAEDDSLKDH
jgi:hypothetical protein